MTRSFTSKKLLPFGTTIFSEMTKLATEHQAINLSQGFPDFDGPPELIDLVAQAMREGHNQYARSMGHPELVTALAETEKALYGLDYDPMTEVVVTSGATEAIASSILGLIDPGDEVVLFEPFYDSYPVAVAMAGGIARYVTLRFPRFSFDPLELEAKISSKTKLIVLNSPNNPTGRVFGTEELGAIARIAIKHDLVVLSDEVYEHLTYDGVRHVPIATLPGMRERTLTISSAGKTFSFTGWKIGWAFGPPALVGAVQSAHQFVTFATSTPVQVGLARAIKKLGLDYYEKLRAEYTERRDFLFAALESAGLDASVPEGTYFIIADFSPIWFGDDRSFAKHLVEVRKVAAIPPSVFYHDAIDEGRHLIRFAFCKKMETLRAASERFAPQRRDSLT
jgi:N-succinyldiaminopimelate aminotransferase